MVDDRRGHQVGNPGAQGRRYQGQVGADGDDAAGIHLGALGQVLQAPAAVGHDAPVDVAVGVVDAVGKLAGEAGGVRTVGAALPPNGQGEGNIVAALAVGRALGHQVGDAAVAGQEVTGGERALTIGNAKVAEDAVGADGRESHPVDGGEVAGPQGDFLRLRSHWKLGQFG